MKKQIKVFKSVGAHPEAIEGIESSVNAYLNNFSKAVRSVEILTSSVALNGGSNDQNIRIIYTVITETTI